MNVYVGIFILSRIILTNSLKNISDSQKIDTFIKVLEKSTFKGFWEIQNNKSIKYFENTKGYILLDVYRYNISSNNGNKDYLRFIITLLDGYFSNNWLILSNHGLTFQNMTYDLEGNSFLLNCNTTKVELGNMFESKIVSLASGKIKSYFI